MKNITQYYIDGKFVNSIGQEKFELVNPSTNRVIGTVQLALFGGVKQSGWHKVETNKIIYIDYASPYHVG
ncbi:hypothetical protein ABQG65_14060 [Yersinia alsatica]|uniref:hypothetical protein n=1 Tax=Yersinia alsatica TaxID=2890317 RepID=UPI0032ED8DB4